jgi:hypothetical protein
MSCPAGFLIRAMKKNTMLAFLFLAAVAIARPSPAQSQPSGEARVFSAGQLLTNDSIVRLVKAGVGQDTILHAVNTRAGAYALGVEDIIALKKAGVPDEVLNAMLDHSGAGCSPALTVPMEILAAPPTAGSSAGQQQSQPLGTATPPSSSEKSTIQTGAKATSQGAQAPVYHYAAGANNNKHQGTKTPRKSAGSD